MPFNTIQLPLQGLDDREPLSLPRERSPNLRNVRMQRNRIVKSPGTALFATLPGTFGTPRAFAQVQVGAPLTEKFLALTSTGAFVYNTGTAAWGATAELYTGAASQRFSVANTQTIAAFSQGTDNIRQWDGTTFSSLVTVGTNHAARVLLAFNDRVISVYTREAGIDYPTRIRWSVNGNVNDFSGLGSGLLEIVRSSNDPLTAGFVLGGRCYLAKPREIAELVATGLISPVFTERPAVVRGTGFIGRYSVGVGEYYAFGLGPDQIYRWDGASITPVGDRVYKTISSLVDYNALDKVQGVVHQTDSEYWLLVSETAEGGVFIYDYFADRWYRDHWPNIRSLGVFTVGGTLTTAIAQSEFVIHGISDGTTLRVDPTLSANNGAAIDAKFEVPDYLAQKISGRQLVLSLDFLNTLWRVYAKASSVTELGVSKDGGVTFVTRSPSPNSDGFVHAFFQQPHQQIRIRLRSNSTAAWAVENPLQYEWTISGVSL